VGVFGQATVTDPEDRRRSPRGRTVRSKGSIPW
jgi:hypothetical protein